MVRFRFSNLPEREYFVFGLKRTSVQVCGRRKRKSMGGRGERLSLANEMGWMGQGIMIL